jgi:hypothetical protein
LQIVVVGPYSGGQSHHRHPLLIKVHDGADRAAVIDPSFALYVLGQCGSICDHRSLLGQNRSRRIVCAPNQSRRK